MNSTPLALLGAALTLVAAAPVAWAQELPLPPVRASGLTVTPVYEGWYDNPDGSITLSFGYFNRNTNELIEIPRGENNRVEPAELDGGQPEVFHARRHWGVFGIRVPGNFDGRVAWVLVNRGETFTIPANLGADFKIDALQEAAADNTPPVVRFGERGPEGAGPAGVFGAPLTGRVGQPVSISVWARDDGQGFAGLGGSIAAAAAGGRRRVPPIALTWFKHQGPGDVTFSQSEGTIPVEGGTMTTTATFSEPGEYVLRVRVNDITGVEAAGHSQCCWSNGFVKVNVTR